MPDKTAKAAKDAPWFARGGGQNAV